MRTSGLLRFFPPEREDISKQLKLRSVVLLAGFLRRAGPDGRGQAVEDFLYVGPETAASPRRSTLGGKAAKEPNPGPMWRGASFTLC
jgi:hypothetical protein